nr:uncharacterized protein LOC116427150 [Nomia melanderi]
MSANTKFFVRPKVRFCQIDVDESNTQELKHSVNQKNFVDTNKPKIRSIVTLNKPVILIKSNKSCSDQENKDLKSTNSIQRTDLSSESNNAVSPCAKETSTVVTNTCCNIETPLPLNNVNNTQNINVHSEEADKLKRPDKSVIDSLASSSASSVQEKASNKVPKAQNSVKTNVIKRDKKGKENNASLLKKGTKNNVKKSLDSKMTQCKVKPCSNSINSKKVNIAKPSASLASKRLKSKPTVDVMPCYKYNTVVSKIKTSPVKKTMVRDIVGSKVKPYIGPGVPRKRQDIQKVPEIKEKSHIKPCTSGEKLAKPEYNSIMCTINKLNEIKKQRNVVDFEHLSPAYKNLINGKISSALDFPLDEAVYKNLVDLSIDEKQLPSRLIRSKDPEPRQRDIVPVLSDFFIPESTEEYYTPVSIKPRAAETVDSWSAFKISDKIFEWKHSLDHV